MRIGGAIYWFTYFHYSRFFMNSNIIDLCMEKNCFVISPRFYLNLTEQFNHCWEEKRYISNNVYNVDI